jgi:hypothetical protein
MRRMAALLGFAAMLMAASVGTAGAGNLANSSTGGVSLTAQLLGENEVPPADPDGSGTAVLMLNSGRGMVCFQISVSNIALPATGAHIHEGEAGVNGSIVVVLTPPDESGTSSGCVEADRDLIKAIRRNPAGYYVNVHTTEYPGGAIRGQLSK